MTRSRLRSMVAALVISGWITGIAMVALLVYNKVDGNAAGLVATLVASTGSIVAGIARNLFPGPEIDVVPPTKDAPEGG
mgnify:FL=1